jgi:DNA (cytosine-5)-methyltransferase 3A
MNVLSLFDGMSCGRIVLDRLGIKVDNYYASEIDKYAIQVSQANYPDIIQVGDITELDLSTLPKIDLVMGGSPCQGFSFAGKQLAFDDPRSALFFEFVRCVEELKPKYFLLENVRMKKEYLDVISEYMGVEPIMINSALVSAQNRVRYYWTNIPGIEQPEQRGIVLRDILETKEVEGLSDKAIDYMNRSSDKWSGGKTRKDIYIKHESEKGMCLTANMHKGVPYGVIAVDKPKVVAGAWRGRYYKDGVRQDQFGSVAGKTKQMLELRKDEKTNTVTTVQKDNVVVTTKPKRVGTIKDGSQGDRIYSQDAKGITLNAQSGGTAGSGNMLVEDKEVYWRKLTPVECERLQTVPDNYTNHVSNTQRYKMLGNGWTIEVITHILKNMEL